MNDNDTTDARNNDDTYKLFIYNGAFYKIPEEYKFTKTTSKEFWNLYYFGAPVITLGLYDY